MNLCAKASNYMVGIILLIVVGIISGCSNSGSGNNSPANPSGTLSFNKSAISVTKGSTQTVILSFSSNESNANISVDLTSADSGVAVVSPSICALSNSSTPTASCKITISGISNNSTTISATATGYQAASASVTVSSTSIPGTLAFAESTTPIYVSESSIAYLSLVGSSGVASDPVILSSSNPAISISPPTCTLATANSLCTIALSASTSATATITATSSLTGAITTMQAVASTTPTVGILNLLPASVLIAAQSGSQSPTATISLSKSAGVHNLWVSVSNNSNPSVASPGNIVQNNISVGNCCLSSNIESNTCNFNAVGQGATGTTKITWAAVANGGGSCPAINATPESYSSVALNVTASTIQAVARTFTIVNNCAESVYFGISGGAVGNSATSQSDCPANSTYAAGKSTCFWNNPTPTNGYALAANGGSTAVSISASDYSGQQWSGGIAGRTACTESGLCQTGSCTGTSHGVGGVTGLACAITHGFDIPNSAAEFTLLNNGNDAYDITLIGGVIVPLSMQPNNNTITPIGNPYQCGNAGSAAAQYGFFNGAQQVLNASNWTPSPSAYTSPNTNVTTPIEAYNYVSGTSLTNPTCSTGAAGSYSPNSQMCGAGLTCGYTYDAIFNPEHSYKYTCGTRLGWISAATIFAANEHSSNVAPFGFNLNPSPSGSNPNGYSIGEWSQCVHPPFNSSYLVGTPDAQTCGGTNWDGIATPESGFLSSNLTWQQEILPRITWIKQSCPSCYSYQYDDNSSSFTCQTQASTSNPANATNYTVTFCPK